MTACLKLCLKLFLLAWLANIASCFDGGTYQGVIGNLCGTAETDNIGPCFEALPTGGFPITYAWDNGGVSVVGKLSFVEDRFDAKLMWLNFGVYFVLFGFIFMAYARLKNRRKL